VAGAISATKDAEPEDVVLAAWTIEGSKSQM
jgi:hypothetical protein